MLLLAVAATPSPADGLSLLGTAPSPPAAATDPWSATPATPSDVPSAPDPSSRLPALPAVLIVATATLAARPRRGAKPQRRPAARRTPAPGRSEAPPPPPPPPPPPEPVVVFVSGHGSNQHATFADLVGRLGLSADRVRYFDYRYALPPTTDHVAASEDVPIGEVAIALNGFLAGLADAGAPIYLVGHSKGGVAIAEMLAHWDARPSTAIRAVTGATLLDPPMADGLLGALQRSGSFIGPVPDNGGYDPVECHWLVFCHDRREHLGESAGVGVVVIRNPDAWITSLADRPAGLRILDLDDGGGHALGRLWRRGSVIGRMAEAHLSVLHHPTVAECVRAEIAAAGSCRWPGETGGVRPVGWVGVGPGRAPNVVE